jgi:hemoglobin
MAEEPEQTLYDRIGGHDTVSRLIVGFYQRVLADPDLRPFFEDVPVDKLTHMQSEFFATALDGPLEYTGRPLHEVHAGLGIRPRHLKLFLDHLLETLEEFDVSRDDRYDIVSRINTYADEITGGVSVDG